MGPLAQGFVPLVASGVATPASPVLRQRSTGVAERREISVSESRQPEPRDNAWREQYWKRNLRLMVTLLAIWFSVSFGAGILFVEQLNEIVIADFPLGFWFAQQGAIYTFVVLILVYAKRMDRLDEEFGVDERDAGGKRL